MVSQIIPPGSVFHPSQVHAYEVCHPGHDSFAVPAYVTRPSGPGAFPALILTHGVHGYEEHMKEVARRFAAFGYACIVPALYCRDDFLAVVEEEEMARASASLSSRHNMQTVGDLNGSLAYLQNSTFVNGRIGLVGFCSGGRLALIFDRFPNINAGAAEVGHGWLPHWLIRLEEMCNYVSGTTPKTDYKPIEYAQMGRFRCGAEPFEGPAMTKAVIDLLGTDALMHQSDYPHGEAHFPDTAEMVIDWPFWNELRGDALEKHMSGNAEKFLRII